MKAFREILENPRYIGAVLVIIISLLLALGAQYVQVTKVYIETIHPSSRAAWTNMTSPSLNWTSNGRIDSVMINSSILLGNYSVKASVSNATEIWLANNNIGAVNCSGSEFSVFYYKLNYTSASAQNASTATLRLYSLKNESNYFEFNLRNARYLNSSNSWIDANVTLGLSASNWTVGSGSPDWSNITGVEFRLGFVHNDTLSLLLNGVYFGGKYDPQLDVVGFDFWFSQGFTASLVNTLLGWLVLAALLWLTIRTFTPEGIVFKSLLIITGYTFVTAFIITPIDILCVSQFPNLRIPNWVANPESAREFSRVNDAINNLNANWTGTSAYLVYSAFSIISFVWTVALLTIALKVSQNYSWKRAAIIGIVAYLMALVIGNIIRAFLLGGL